MEPDEQLAPPQPSQELPKSPKKNRKLLLIGGGVILLAIIIVLLSALLKPATDLHIDAVSSCSQIAPRYIGLSESDATKKASKEGRVTRVVERDGKFSSIGRDTNTKRLDFTILKHIVRGAGCG